MSSTESGAIVRGRARAAAEKVSWRLEAWCALRAGQGEGLQQSLHCRGSAGQAAWFQKEINGSEANATQGLVP